MKILQTPGIIFLLGCGLPGQTPVYFNIVSHNEITDVLQYVQTLPPGQNDFYTMNMLINFRDIPQVPSFADSIASIIDDIEIWDGIPE